MKGFFLKDRDKKRGFTIIEALVLLFIFMVIVTTFYRFFASGTYLVLEAKKKLIAVNIANERIEFIRSLPYGEVGTVSGVPLGDIDSLETVTRGNYGFEVLTSIVYHNDEYDGTGTDSEPNDYKKIAVSVKWGEGAQSQTVSLSSIVAPFGEEVAIAGGILNVSVIDIAGAPVPDVSVNISNLSVSYNQNVTTNASGGVTLIGLPVSNQQYVITLGKTGFEDDVFTLPPYPATSFYPTNVHSSVISGSTTNAVFSFSRQSDFTIKFINPIDDSVIPDIGFSLEGGRVIGTNTDGSLVHNFDEDSLAADSSGEESITDASPGQYTVNVSDPNYVFWKTDSGSGNNADEILVEQGESGQTKDVYLLDKTRDSYFVKITDSVTGAPLEGVLVEVSSVPLGFTDTTQADEYGYGFISGDEDDILAAGETYNVKLTKPGYSDKNDDTVVISQLTQGELSIDPQ
ncbi:MAG TPA: hypothetical protein DCX32_00955 [Candidatus Moranbacteria bacterium]|nr:MAG: Prepilin-type cleavage/methylation domain containing protein [Candidatus Moranbacteria bacterium GW2011_GWC2_45_10]KKT94348.1 MAG: Prepilin-type cleavage/methylation domain containing protein [Parcubacteria group bacterium GW2011_GWC1_45_14]HAV11105.1 hypothetical protein [Candidatus Moranbacteria bacterium]